MFTYIKDADSINAIKTLEIHLYFLFDTYIIDVGIRNICFKNACIRNNWVKDIYIRNNFIKYANIKSVCSVNIIKNLKIHLQLS